MLKFLGKIVDAILGEKVRTWIPYGGSVTLNTPKGRLVGTRAIQYTHRARLPFLRWSEEGFKTDIYPHSEHLFQQIKRQRGWVPGTSSGGEWYLARMLAEEERQRQKRLGQA